MSEPCIHTLNPTTSDEQGGLSRDFANHMGMHMGSCHVQHQALAVGQFLGRGHPNNSLATASCAAFKPAGSAMCSKSDEHPGCVLLQTMLHMTAGSPTCWENC